MVEPSTGAHSMPERFLSAYDEAHSLLMEAVWEKYASQPVGAIRESRTLDTARADTEPAPALTVA
jgi:hypothetical protein